jgi:hypothetical protein
MILDFLARLFESSDTEAQDRKDKQKLEGNYEQEAGTGFGNKDKDKKDQKKKKKGTTTEETSTLDDVSELVGQVIQEATRPKEERRMQMQELARELLGIDSGKTDFAVGGDVAEQMSRKGNLQMDAPNLATSSTTMQDQKLSPVQNGELFMELVKNTQANKSSDIDSLFKEMFK